MRIARFAPAPRASPYDCAAPIPVSFICAEIGVNPRISTCPMSHINHLLTI